MNVKSSGTFLTLIFLFTILIDLPGQTAEDTLCYRFRMAAWEGDSTTLKQIADSTKLDIDCTAWDQYNALGYAIREGHTHIVKMLLPWGADPNDIPGKTVTPIELAIRDGHTEITELLILYGAKLDTILLRGHTPLTRSVNNNHLLISDMLLHYGASPDLPMHDGTTPLLIAVMYADLDHALLLFDYGANVNPEDQKGYTPLMVAAWLNDTLMLQWLLHLGADPSLTNFEQRNALAFAIANQAHEAAWLLLEVTPENDLTGLDRLAVGHRNKEAIGMLKERGFKPGWSPVITNRQFRYGVSINKQHRMWHYTYGLRDQRYNATYGIGFAHRYRPATIFHQPEGVDTLTYQFQGRRYNLFVSLDKHITLLHNTQQTLSLTGGFALGYHWGSYRGAPSMMATQGIVPALKAAVTIEWKNLMASGGYQLAPYREKPIPAGHFTLEAAILIPTQQFIVTPKPLSNALKSL